MTLLQMVNIICSEMGVYDDTSVALVRSFLDKEYNILWDKYLWKDTETTATVTVLAGTSSVALPAEINRIVTVIAINLATGTQDTPGYTSDARMIESVSSKFMIETDPTEFRTGGYIKYYEERGYLSDGGKNIRFFPTPVMDTEITIYGKAVCPGLVNDIDSSWIRNVDPVLISYATADMLQRQRQYGKADLKYKRGQELEQVAWNLEQQQANQPRLTKATTVAGNSLAEMTDAVCQICGLWTPDYRIVIREFLRRNYQALYDLYLWPESLVMVRVPYTTEQVIMPSYVDKVLGIRGTSDLRMFPADAGLFLDVSPSSFDEIGDPIGYTTLTPVAVSTLPSTTTNLVFASTSPVDTSPVFVRGEVISSGTEVEEEILLNGTTPVTSTRIYDVPLTISKDITVGDVTVNGANDYLGLEVIPSYQRELKHQRLWFLPVPDSSKLGDGETFTCLVLGKRAIRPLLTEQDSPIITGAQQVLIAAAAGDLFRKLEKPDMANAFLQKASGSTDALKAKNTDQAASAPRFVPSVEPRAYALDCVW